MHKVIAIIIADIHLSHKPPVARSAEPDWYSAMRRPLDEITELQDKFDGCPVLCTGDVFHYWNEPVELVNWAMRYLPNNMYSVAGNHDIPHHQMKDIEKSAYWTLVRAEKLVHLPSGAPVGVGGPNKKFVVYGFSWNAKRFGVKQENRVLKLALVHKYVWAKDNCFKGAPADSHARNLLTEMFGYDVIATGDNHIGFKYHQLFNAGSLMCRNSDQKEYKPRVGLLLEDGVVDVHYLDTSQDKWVEDDSPIKKFEIDFSDLVQSYMGLHDKQVNFVDALRRLTEDKKHSESVRRIILEVLEDANDG